MKLFFVLTMFVVLPILSAAQVINLSEHGETYKSKEFFKNDKPLELTLTSNFKTLRSKKEKGVYQHAIATFHFNDKDSVSDSIRIYARGNFRRENCQMPSLMINFKSKASAKLDGLKKMKMVCGCTSSKYNEGLVLVEYLAYRIYNTLTDMSFKTRLVKVTYEDANHKVKPYSQWAFLIEDVDEMAQRNNAIEYEKTARALATNRSQMTMMTIFQYMIGNLDWSIPNYHNIKLIQLENDSVSLPYIVPYDFDFSGLVNAPYAFPNHENFAVEKVTDRFYRGMPRSAEEVEDVLKIYRKKKDDVMKLISEFDLLDEKSRGKTAAYIEEFYTIINSKKAKTEFEVKH